MPADPKPPPTDAELDHLARGWFAEARAQTREDERSTRRSLPADSTAGDGDGGLFEWLFGGDDAADDGEGGD